MQLNSNETVRFEILEQKALNNAETSKYVNVLATSKVRPHYLGKLNFCIRTVAAAVKNQMQFPNKLGLDYNNIGFENSIQIFVSLRRRLLNFVALKYLNRLEN